MRVARAAMLCAALLSFALPLHAQGWFADLYAGGHRYGPSAAALRSTSLVAAIRSGSPADAWLYAMAAAPLEGDAPRWAAAGLARRWTVGSPAPTSRIGIAAAADGYVYRDPNADRTGRGITLDAGPFVDTWFGRVRAELRASWRHHLAADGDDELSRAAPEVAARLERAGPVHIGATARWVRVSEGSYAVAAADLAAAVGPLRIAAGLERWLASDMQDVGWSVYASLPTPRVEIWAGLRHDARDPLYWNPARRTWNAGVSIPLGRPRAAAAPPQILQDGGVRLQVARTAAEGPVYVAGDFTAWQPQPMTATPEGWEYTARLGSGVYHYAYVDGAGRWFVPADTPGRMDDGMGGHVAVLVVP